MQKPSYFPNLRQKINLISFLNWKFIAFKVKDKYGDVDNLDEDDDESSEESEDDDAKVFTLKI